MNVFPGAKFDIRSLATPPAECEVTYTWIWNEPITREGIDERLSGFLEAGIRSLYILPIPIDFRPESSRSYLFPDYLTKEFWDMVEYALRKCVSLGIKPWIYDEGGWPSGGACYNTLRENPKAKTKHLSKEEITLFADKRFCPSHEGFIALFRGKKRLPDDYIASSDNMLTAYYVTEKASNCRVDYTNPSVTDTFLNNTYEGYKKIVGDLFGNDIPLIFTDEPGLMRDSLAENEFELFEKEYGYDLRDYLYVIEKDGVLAQTEAEKQARADHLLLLGKLTRRNTFDRIRTWCEKNGVLYGGHLDIDNRPYGGTTKGYFSLLYGLRALHVPGIDVIWEQIRYPYGGRSPVNDETSTMKFFPRIAPSAAHQEGRNVALTETFSLSGDGISPNDMRYSANYQAIRGINAFNFMTAPYGKKRCSAFSGRPAFCPEKPGFKSLKQINGYYARLSYLLRLGYAEIDTALYLPCLDFSASPNDLDDTSIAFSRLGEALENENIPFDIIDDFGIRDAEDTGYGLKIGAALYKKITVPECRYMPKDVEKKIAPYLGKSAPIYTFKNDMLRAQTRLLDSGRLWFIFNEGEPTVREELKLCGGKYIYEIDVNDGSLYLESEPVLNLECGDIAVYYVTDDVLETMPSKALWRGEATDFEPISYKRFLVGYDGIYNEYGSGAPCVPEEYAGETITVLRDNIPADFSGEITYLGKYTLKNAPRADRRYKITLEGFGVSAVVKLGEKEYPLGTTPMSFTVLGEELSESGEIYVTLANTAANEILAKYDLIRSISVAELGTYSDKIIPFEEKRHKMRFGKLWIEELL